MHIIFRGGFLKIGFIGAGKAGKAMGLYFFKPWSGYFGVFFPYGKLGP
jgi:hypothetical protein